MEKGNRANFGSKLGLILATAGSGSGSRQRMALPVYGGTERRCAIHHRLCGLRACAWHTMYHERIHNRQTFRLKHGEGLPQTCRQDTFRTGGISGSADGTPRQRLLCRGVGWCFEYIYASAAGQLNGDPQFFADFFNTFEKDPVKPIFWAVTFLIVTHLIIIRGVKDGIEKASKMMMPALFVLLIVLVVASCMLPNAWAGVEYLFKPDFSKVTKELFLGALGQAFFSLSIGMGCLCTFALTFRKKQTLRVLRCR